MQGLSFITAPSTAALSHRKPAFNGNSTTAAGLRAVTKENTLHSLAIALFSLSFTGELYQKLTQ